MNSKINIWITKNEYIDIETGEILDKENLRDFIIIKKDKSYKINDKENVRIITNHCKQTTQLKLF